ncbi:MAG TPA: MFS transporter [Streptosporangiaceae bacterium]|nr:MFS transporter [Streptosporangiaceae bacterium]
MPTRLRRAQLGVLVYFGVLGLASGDWLARIPAIKHSLGLSDGTLGLALLAASAGQVVVAMLAGRIVHRIGSRMPIVISGFCVPLLPVTFGVVPNQAAFMGCLFGFGFAGGLLDVAMNAQAVYTERGFGRPLMTSFHACYSFGALAGGLIGGLFAWAQIRPSANFAIVAAPLSCLALSVGRWLLPDDKPAERAQRPQQGDQRPSALRRSLTPAVWRTVVTSPLAVLGLLSLCSLLGEGAADGWSAVYLRDNLGTSAWFAAFGFAAFSVTMATGRLAGDRLALRFGPGALVRGGGLLAAIGMTCALISPVPAGTIAGFALYGAGLSCIFPQLLSAAGSVRPGQTASGIAAVAGMGYVGLLSGPVLIGGLASVAGLTVALGLPALLALAIAAGAGVAMPTRAPG